MACNYSISGHLEQDCVPTAPGYNSKFYLCTWDAFQASVLASEISVTESTDKLAHVVSFSSEAPTLKPLYLFEDPRTAVFSGSTKAKAETPMSIPYFTKSLQIGIDKNAHFGGATTGGSATDGAIAEASKLINVLSAGRFVLFATRIDGKGVEAFGALSPLKATATDQSLASDDANSGMVTLTLECTEGDFATAVKETADKLTPYVSANA